VASPHVVSGRELREQFASDVSALTFGLVRMRGTSMVLGPLEILRFGRPKVTRSGVSWPVEGGLAARAGGGKWSITASGGRLVASLEGYRPRIPVPLYRLTQLPIHHLVMRLHLLRAEPGSACRPDPPYRRWDDRRRPVRRRRADGGERPPLRGVCRHRDRIPRCLLELIRADGRRRHCRSAGGFSGWIAGEHRPSARTAGRLARGRAAPACGAR